MLMKIGKILLDPNEVVSVSKTYTNDPNDSYNIQIVYKNGVVKNFKLYEIVLDYDTFVNTLLELQEKLNDDHLLRLMIVSQSMNK